VANEGVERGGGGGACKQILVLLDEKRCVYLNEPVNKLGRSEAPTRRVTNIIIVTVYTPQLFLNINGVGRLIV